jgi:hypothetical protein
VVAYNAVGQVGSNVQAAYVADVPAAPAAGPSVVISETMSASIRLTFDALDATDAAQTGGSPILSYNLQRTPALGVREASQITDTFFDVGGSLANYSVSTAYTILDLVQGQEYAFRYRGINVNGPGSWSPTVIMRPATVPQAPAAAPVYVSSTETSFTIALTASPFDGGQPVTSYQLEIDQGTPVSSLLAASASTFTPVTSYVYATHGFSYTIGGASTFADPALTLVAGLLYRLRFKAINFMGGSGYSDTSRIGLGALPAQLATGASGLRRRADEASAVDPWNSATSIGLQWEAPSAAALPITEYILRVDDGLGVVISEAYRGPLTEARVNNLTAGVQYTFTITAANYNGEGTASTALSLRSCIPPASVLPPTRVSSTSESVTLRWS